MAVTLTTLKARIATELHRDDLTSEIASAITSAIALYQSKRFEFNEKQASFNTVASQQSYTSGDTGFPTDIAQIDKVRVTVSSRYVYPTPKTFNELTAMTSASTDTGPPDVHWAWYAAKLFFYPIPDAVYSVQLSYLQRKAAPSSDADDTTIWTNQCGDLIRHCAKRIVARDYMYGKNEVLFARGEQEALATLRGESAQLQEGGGLAPSW
jgi:hypothetical protein